jgi:hypothetical protein
MNTQTDLKNDIEIYIRNNVNLSKRIEDIIALGAIDVEAINPNQYSEVKVIAYAALLSIANDLQLVTKDNVNKYKQIEKSLKRIQS